MKQLFIGNKKYFTLFAVMILFLVIVGILSPIYIRYQSNKWAEELRIKIEDFTDVILDDFYDIQFAALDLSTRMKKELRTFLPSFPASQEKVINYINSSFSQNDAIGIYNEDKNLIAWTESYSSDPDLVFSPRFQYGELFFTDSGLIKFLSIKDTLNVDNNTFYFIVSIPVEKEYTLKNNYYTEISFSKGLSEKLHTKVEIEYSPTAAKTKDGRKYSFDLLNNFNNKIAVVTFLKPSIDTEMNLTSDTFDAIQSLIMLSAFLLLGVGFLNRIMKIKRRYIRFVVFILYLSLFRVMAFLLNVPSRFFEGELTNSTYFSSTFAAGLVRSPLEFFITTSFALFICLLAYRFTLEYLQEKQKVKISNEKIWKSISTVILFTVLYLVTLRGFNASIRSVIFDSTLRYFKDPAIGLDLPTVMMQLNVLILGFCSILASVVFIVLVFSIGKFEKKRQQIFYISFFVLLQAAAFLYDLFQKQPQGTPLIRIIHISLVFLLSYLILFRNKRSQFNYVLVALAASVVSINLLIFNNFDLERESLKVTALEITRPNEGFLNFLVYETLQNIGESEEVKNCFKNVDNNFYSTAFNEWSKSTLQIEAVPCRIDFYNQSMEFLGGFKFRMENEIDKYLKAPSINIDGITIFNEELTYYNCSVIRGSTPIIDNEDLLGFLDISVLYNTDLKSVEDIPPFLLARNASMNSTVDFSKLKIFDFHNGELKSFIADINLTQEEQEQIINADYTKNNEAWLNISLHGVDHLIYCLKLKQSEYERIVATALQEKDLSWSLFDFFKIFFVHIIFIVLFLVVLVTFLIWRKRIPYLSFRNKLLSAFLLISIIPLILLAVYFRKITEEKNFGAISYKLGKRAFSVERYLNDYLNNSTLNTQSVFEKARKDLGISFSLFDGGELIYSSEDLYYRLGLMPSLLNPIVFSKLYDSGYKEYVVSEKVESFSFNSYYYKAEIVGKELVIGVNSLFNSILLPLSDIEIDVFLFSFYSLVALLIIIISTIFANQISSPIRRITKATKAVASGDLSFEITEDYSGEVKELLDNFNIMIKQLKISQKELAQVERETAWKEMAKQVAHEIKNPLTPMKLAIQQLVTAFKDKSPKFDEIFHRVTETVVGQIETLRNIASEFSNFARMPGLNVEKIDVVKTINEAVNLFIEEGKEIKIYTDLSKSFVMGDVDQLKRTIINLIRNSLQANASNVDIIIGEDENNLYIRVKDNGKGIPNEIVNKIFEEEFTTKLKGMGLGLSMAKRYITSVNGSIIVEETSERGTIVLLTFPKEK